MIPFTNHEGGCPHVVVTVRSPDLFGVSGYGVGAEFFPSSGLSAFDVLGLPNATVKKTREPVQYMSEIIQYQNNSIQ